MPARWSLRAEHLSTGRSRRGPHQRFRGPGTSKLEVFFVVGPSGPALVLWGCVCVGASPGKAPVVAHASCSESLSFA